MTTLRQNPCRSACSTPLVDFCLSRYEPFSTSPLRGSRYGWHAVDPAVRPYLDSRLEDGCVGTPVTDVASKNHPDDYPGGIGAAGAMSATSIRICWSSSPQATIGIGGGAKMKRAADVCCFAPMGTLPRAHRDHCHVRSRSYFHLPLLEHRSLDVFPIHERPARLGLFKWLP